MKRFVVGLAMVMMLMAGGPAAAAEATAAVDVNSAYVWRGITFNDGMVAQPSIDVTNGKFGINVWGNYDIDDYDGALDDNEFSEVDLTLYYGFTLDPVEIGIGVIEYLFPGGAEGTHEAYLSLGLPIAGGLSLGAAAYYDFDQVDGFYGNVSIAYGLDLSESFSMEISAAAGYADEDFAEAYGGEDGGLFDYTLSLGLSYAVTEAWSLSASINYVDTLDDDVLLEDLADTNLYGGVSVAYAF
jgi:opacity protein-like surface antigen